MIELNKLSTEQRNKNSIGIELKTSKEILACINEEDKTVAYSIEKKIDEISVLIDEILKRYKPHTRIIYIGSGTSGRLGILDASECPPTYGVSPEKIQGLIAGGYEAMFKAKENAEDDYEAGKKDLQDIGLCEDDVVIGLTASGRTPYVIGAIQYANSINALTGGISCSYNSELSKVSKCPIEVIVGPEIVTGSTRMKAGTCQKLILNMISTTMMIKLGKVFSGYMIEVKTSNEKLIERAKRIIENTTGVTYEVASQILKEADFDVKTAIVMILLGENKENALLKIQKNPNIARLIHEFANKN